MSLATMIQVGSPEWQAARLTGVGASEAASACGWDSHRSALQLYLLKTGKLEPDKPNASMKRGLLLEPLVSELYEERTGRRIDQTQVFARDSARPHMLATLDGIDETGDLVEFKTIGPWSEGNVGPDGSTELPETWLVQANQQMLVAESEGIANPESVTFAVLHSDDRLTIHTVKRSPSLCRSIVSGVDAFWDRVQRLDPPPPTEADVSLLRLVYPVDLGEIDLAPELVDKVMLWEIDKAEIRRLEKRAEEDRATLLLAMGGHTSAAIGGGRVLKRNVIDVNYKAQEARTTTQVRLTVTTPKGAK